MSMVRLMRGLPGSGKTTWARTLQAGHPGLLYVGLDGHRALLRPERLWNTPHEQVARAAHDAALLAAVRAGHDVVVDNTHLTPGYPARIKRLLADYRVRYVVHDLIHVPIHTCIARDAARARAGRPAVGDAGIRELWHGYLAARATGWDLTAEWMHHPPTGAADPTPPDLGAVR